MTCMKATASTNHCQSASTWCQLCAFWQHTCGASTVCGRAKRPSRCCSSNRTAPDAAAVVHMPTRSGRVHAIPWPVLLDQMEEVMTHYLATRQCRCAGGVGWGDVSHPCQPGRRATTSWHTVPGTQCQLAHSQQPNQPSSAGTSNAARAVPGKVVRLAKLYRD